MEDFLDFVNPDYSGMVEVRHQNALDLLGSLPPGSVDLVLTDPPYGISYQSNHRKEKSAPIASDWKFNPAKFLEEVARVLRDGSAAYIFTRWDVYPDWFFVVPDSLEVKNLIVWNKNNWSAGDLTGNFGGKWEALMLLVKGRHQIRGHRYSNVWDFPRVPFGVQRHPAEKPVPLLQRAIESSTDLGDLIVDPFCGSGSTAEAAVNLKRRALIGDVDTQCLKSCLERLGLPPNPAYEDPLLISSLQKPGNARNTQIDLSVLDGVHPEDILAMLADWRGR